MRSLSIITAIILASAVEFSSAAPLEPRGTVKAVAHPGFIAKVKGAFGATPAVKVSKFQKLKFWQKAPVKVKTPHTGLKIAGAGLVGAGVGGVIGRSMDDSVPSVEKRSIADLD